MRNFESAAFAAALALGGFASAASATTFVYDFSSNDGTENATGRLTATANGNGTFTAISGTIDASGPLASGTGTLTSNASAPAASYSPSGAFTYDDQLLPGQNPLITNPGLLFKIGGTEVNIFSNGPGPGTYSLDTWAGGYGYQTGNFTLSAVPEPASWAMMLIGFGLIGSMMRASRKPATA